MRLIIFQVLLLVGIAICQTQKPLTFSSFGRQSSSINRGRYQPALRTTTYRPYRTSSFGNVATSNKRVGNSGRYTPGNDGGRYKAVADGRYKPVTDGRYKPVTDGRYKPVTDGRYKPVTDGRYKPGAGGRYQAGDAGKYTYTDASGRYKDSGHGKYINGKYVDGPYVDGKYVGDNSGFYDGSDNPYQHKDVGGGQYKGENVPYEPYKDKQYPGGAYKGNKSGSGYQGSRGSQGSETPDQGAKIGSNSAVYRPSTSGVGLSAADPKYVDNAGYSTLGVPQGLEKSDAAGLYEKYNYGIVINNKDISPEGDYHYQYETENKIFGEEKSEVVSDQEEHKSGYYKYTGPDSNVYIVTYKAGVEGFVPEGKHIPTAPPIPELIQRSLDLKRKMGLL